MRGLNSFQFICLLLLKIQSKDKKYYIPHFQKSKLLQKSSADYDTGYLSTVKRKGFYKSNYKTYKNDCLLYKKTIINIKNKKCRPCIPDPLCTDELVEQNTYPKCHLANRPIYYPMCRKDKRPFFPQNCPPCPTQTACKTSQEVITELNALLVNQPTLLRSALSQIKDKTNIALTTDLEAFETELVEKSTNVINILSRNAPIIITSGMKKINEMDIVFERITLLRLIKKQFDFTKEKLLTVINTTAAQADPDLVLTVRDEVNETGLSPQISSEIDALLNSIIGEIGVEISFVMLPKISNALTSGFNIIYSYILSEVPYIAFELNDYITNAIPALKTKVIASVNQVVTNQTPTIQNVLRNYGNELKTIASAVIKCYKGETAPITRAFGVKSMDGISSLPLYLPKVNKRDAMIDDEIL